MSNYRRAYVQGGCYFFTLVTYNRHPVFEKTENIDRLRAMSLPIKIKHKIAIL